MSLPRTRVATIIISGADDGVVSSRNAEALRHLLPNSRLLTIDEAGHAMIYRYPAARVREIGSFAAQWSGIVVGPVSQPPHLAPEIQTETPALN